MAEAGNIDSSQVDKVAQELAKLERFNDILFKAYREGILTKENFYKLMELEGTKTGTARILICYCLQNKISFEAFKKILLEEGLEQMAKSLENKINTNSINSEISEMGNTVNPFSLRISVKTSGQVYGQEDDFSEVYKNTSLPRGYVLIANYMYYHNNCHDSRVGSEIDTRNLSELFRQIGYEVQEHENLTKYETFKVLNAFCERKELLNIDSSVVIIMGHGRDERSFYASDNQAISVGEVLDKFSNIQCPYLKEKPKIFIFQFCRGTVKDVGVCNMQRISNEIGFSSCTDTAEFGYTEEIQSSPTFTDIFIIYSTVEGFVSFRDPQNGSLLANILCREFMEHAHCEDLIGLMNKVQRSLNSATSICGRKQMCEYINRGFHKYFYFNPIGNSQLHHSLSALSLNRLVSTVLPHKQRSRNNSGAITIYGTASVAAVSHEINGNLGLAVPLQNCASNPEPSEDIPDRCSGQLVSLSKFSGQPNCDIEKNLETLSLWQLQYRQKQNLPFSFPSLPINAVSPLKRQLSLPNDQEALKAITNLIHYLKSEDFDEEQIKAFESARLFILQKQQRTKRSKRSYDSQGD